MGDNGRHNRIVEIPTSELHDGLWYRKGPPDFLKVGFIEIIFLMLSSQQTMLSKTLELARELFVLDFLPCTLASNLTTGNNYSPHLA